MPILAWTFSGKNTKIVTKSKALIFVSYTLQDVIAISVLHHGLIYFLCTKSEKNKLESMKKTDSRKAVYTSFCLLFSCKIFKWETQYYSEKDFFFLNVREYWNWKKYKITEVWYKDTNGLEKFIHVRDFYRTQPLRQNRSEKITV